MINFAHRGASGDYPENTLRAFKEAIKIGATGLELDVHLTKDGEVVVIHDEDVERTFKAKGLVKDLTLHELRQLVCRKALFEESEDSRIPLLEEVLDLIKNTSAILNIELKTDVIPYPGIEQKVIQLIQTYGLEDQILISSFNPKSIKECKAINKKIKTGFLYSKPIDQVIAYAKSLEADAIHPDLRLVTEELIQEAHEHRLNINVYTVNAPIYMRKLIAASVDGIFTDYPALLLEIMKERM